MAFAAVNIDGLANAAMADSQMSLRPRYKSFRKKYNKERRRFVNVMEDSIRMHEDEQRLQKVAKRLKEQNDQLLDLLLTLNASSTLPNYLTYSLSDPTPSISSLPSLSPSPSAVPEKPKYTHQVARSMLLEARSELSSGQITQNDYDAILDDVQRNLGGPHSLAHLSASTSYTTLPLAGLHAPLSQPPHPTKATANDLLAELRDPAPLTLLDAQHEDEYLAALDAAVDGLPLPNSMVVGAAMDSHPIRGPPAAVSEASMRNPVSVYNWLRKHQPHVFMQDAAADKDKDGAGNRHGSPENNNDSLLRPGEGKTRGGGLKGDGGHQQPERKGRGKRNSSVQQEVLDEDGNVIGGFAEGIGVGGAGAGGIGRGKRKREDDGSYRPKGGGGGRAKKKKISGKGLAAGDGEGD